MQEYFKGILYACNVCCYAATLKAILQVILVLRLSRFLGELFCLKNTSEHIILWRKWTIITFFSSVNFVKEICFNLLS